MSSFKEVDRCVETYLKRQLKHFRQLKIVYVILYAIGAILCLFLLMVPYIFRAFIWEDVSGWVIALFVPFYIIIALSAIYKFGDWEKNGALPVLIKAYKEGRFVWWDSGYSNLKWEDYRGEDDERFYHALVQASINICGSETTCYSYPDEYVKGSTAFLRILWHTYNCDKKIRKQGPYLTVEEVEQLSKGR